MPLTDWERRRGRPIVVNHDARGSSRVSWNPSFPNLGKKGLNRFSVNHFEPNKLGLSIQTKSIQSNPFFWVSLNRLNPNRLGEAIMIGMSWSEGLGRLTSPFNKLGYDPGPCVGSNCVWTNLIKYWTNLYIASTLSLCLGEHYFDLYSMTQFLHTYIYVLIVHYKNVEIYPR